MFALEAEEGVTVTDRIYDKVFIKTMKLCSLV